MRRPFPYGILGFDAGKVSVMSPEVLSIFGVGVGLAVLMFGMFGWVRSDMARIEERLRQEIRGGDEQLRQEIRGGDERLRQEIHESEQRLIAALVNHRHPQPDGEPAFTQPA